MVSAVTVSVSEAGVLLAVSVSWGCMHITHRMQIRWQQPPHWCVQPCCCRTLALLWVHAEAACRSCCFERPSNGVLAAAGLMLRAAAAVGVRRAPCRSLTSARWRLLWPLGREQGCLLQPNVHRDLQGVRAASCANSCITGWTGTKCSLTSSLMWPFDDNEKCQSMSRGAIAAVRYERRQAQ